MRKETAEQFAQGLYQRNNLQNAIRIAKNSMVNTAPSNYVNLPVGSVFFTKAYGADKWDLNSKRLKGLHGFWKQVYHILLKREKNESKK